MKKIFRIFILISAILLIIYPLFLGDFIHKTFFLSDELKNPQNIKFDIEQDVIDEYNKNIANGYFNADSDSLNKLFDTDNKQKNKNNFNINDLEGKEFIQQIRKMKGYNKVIGYIEIPSIDERILLFYGTDEHSLERGAGILENTSFPSHDKKNIHTVLAGHRGMTNLNVFKNIDKLKYGDILQIFINDDVFTYKMNNRIIRKPGKLNDIYIDPDKNLLTIITCHPYLINNQRMLVFFEKI